MPTSDDTKQLVARLAETARELEAWITRGGSRWWLRGWLDDITYLVRRIDEQDDIDRLEEAQAHGEPRPR